MGRPVKEKSWCSRMIRRHRHSRQRVEKLLWGWIRCQRIKMLPPAILPSGWQWLSGGSCPLFGSNMLEWCCQRTDGLDDALLPGRRTGNTGLCTSHPERHEPWSNFQLQSQRLQKQQHRWFASLQILKRVLHLTISMKQNSIDAMRILTQAITGFIAIEQAFDWWHWTTWMLVIIGHARCASSRNPI